MATKPTARQQMLEYLTQHGGRLEDPDGMAATVLREQLGLAASAKHVLADLEAQGVIRREIRGRRTFAIELVEAPADHPAPAPTRARRDVGAADPVLAGVDLAELADVLLAIVVKRASGPGTGSPELAEALRRAEELQVATEVRLAEVVAERDAAQAQVRELEHRLDVMDRNLRKVTGQRAGTPAGPPRTQQAIDRLDAEGRALLESVFGSLKPS